MGSRPLDALRPLIARSLGPLRRQSPSVIWGAEPMNGGNFLYLWLTAWSRTRRTGKRWTVRFKPKMRPWLEEFPGLREWTVQEHEVGPLQRRTVEWGQQVGYDYLVPEIPMFVREVLLPGSGFPERVAAAVPDAVVVNVRRGDYYSDALNRSRYGMDIEAFIREAVRRIPSTAQERFVLVSDDPPWCMEHLGFLAERGAVQAMPPPHDMFQDLAQLAAARTLILTNSTFSYWGGYLATSRPPAQRPRQILAPLFFTRQYNHGDSPLLLPQWTAIPEDEYQTDPGL